MTRPDNPLLWECWSFAVQSAANVLIGGAVIGCVLALIWCRLQWSRRWLRWGLLLWIGGTVFNAYGLFVVDEMVGCGGLH